MYSHTYLSKDELENLIKDKISPFEVNRVLSAYDMADLSYVNKKSLDGSPYFFHITRICKILISELEIFESDLLICSLINDICRNNSEITNEIIEYNFGPYVTFLLMILKEDYQSINNFKVPQFSDTQKIRIPADDYLIISLTEHLDNFRSIEISLAYNPINYILNTLAILLPAAENSNNQYVKKLVCELKKERNKILG